MLTKTCYVFQNEGEVSRRKRREARKRGKPRKKKEERPLSDLQNIFLEDQRVRRSVVKEEEEKTRIWRTLGQHLVNILQEKILQ